MALMAVHNQKWSLVARHALYTGRENVPSTFRTCRTGVHLPNGVSAVNVVNMVHGTLWRTVEKVGGARALARCSVARVAEPGAVRPLLAAGTALWRAAYGWHQDRQVSYPQSLRVKCIWC